MIILSALGTGKYQETSYQFGRREEIITTGFFAEALTQWYPDASVLILATPTADKTHGEELRRRVPQAQVLPVLGKRDESGNLAEDFTEESYWAMFQTVVDAIPDGEEVIFDITHGFRSLPMLGFLMLAYLRVVKNTTLRRVLYGAWEAKDAQGITPVFDLTPFVTMLDWAQAAKRFEDTGDASLFTPLLKMNRAANFNAVSRQLTKLSEALSANRGRKIGDEATKLQKVIQMAEAQGGLELHQRPFALVIEGLKTQTAPLAHTDDPVLTLQAQYAQIQWYAQRGHLPQAAALAREWLINLRLWQRGLDITSSEKVREDVNGDLYTFWEQPDDAPVPFAPYVRALAQVSLLRNDFMHFGFKDAPADMGQMKQRIHNVLTSLENAAAALGLYLEPSPQVNP